MLSKLFIKILNNMPNKFKYNNKGVGEEIFSEYGPGILTACITGRVGIGQTEKLNEFCSHMAMAALSGDPLGIAVSCFASHGSPFDKKLPIAIDTMDDETFLIFVELLQLNLHLGLSKSIKKYLSLSRESVELKLNNKNPHALWLMGAWYAYDNYEARGEDTCNQERIFWYEKSAFEGYLPAIKAVAEYYEPKKGKDRTYSDSKKAAYWYRKAALDRDAYAAYYVARMYIFGIVVKSNYRLAEMWLSLAVSNDKTMLENYRVSGLCKEYGLELVDNPDLSEDLELSDYTSEFQDAYGVKDELKEIEKEKKYRKNKQNNIFKKLNQLSKSKEIKKHNITIMSTVGGWCSVFEFSDKELKQADELIDELRDLLDDKFILSKSKININIDNNNDVLDLYISDNEITEQDLNGLYFDTFDDASAWAKRNLDYSITRSSKSDGFIAKKRDCN